MEFRNRATAMHHDRRDRRKTSGCFKPDGIAHGGDERRRLPPPRAPGRQSGGYLRRRRPSAAQSSRAAERTQDQDLQSLQPQSGDEQITFHANNNGTAAADLAIAQWVYLQ